MVKSRKALLIGVLLTLPCLAGAADFYVSPSGTSSGDGSLGNPWDLTTALDHPSAVQPGDTLNLLSGSYTGSGRYLSHLSGAPNLYITVRPYNQDRVIVEGEIQVRGPWVVFRDLEVTNFDPKRTTVHSGSFPPDLQRGTGFNVHAPNVKVINNVVHDMGLGLASWIAGPETEFYGNVVYFNGWKGPIRNHGQGLYAQNQLGEKQIQANIIFDNFWTGIQLFGSSQTYLDNFVVEDNILFTNGSLGGLFARNILLGGGRVAKDPVIKRNYTFFPVDGDQGGDNNIGYYEFGEGCSGLELDDNYFVSGGAAITLFRCSVTSLRGNTFVGSLRFLTPSDHPNNVYIPDGSRPLGTRTFVTPNKYEPGRANIAVFNWDLQSVVNVDVSAAGLQTGDTYEIRNVQDYFNDVTQGIYDGSPLAIQMTGRSVAAPAGWTAPNSNFPLFGAFVLRTTTTGAGTIPLTISGVSSSDITAHSAIVTWNTNLPSSSQVEYGEGTFTQASSLDPALTTSHTVTLSGLDGNTTYVYRAKSEDPSGRSVSLEGSAFTTPLGPVPQPEPEPQVPAIEVDQQSVQATQLSSSSAVITWSTNVPGTAQVYYGTSLSYGQNTPVNQALATQHQITITGLDSATLYYFRAESTDATDNVDTAGGFSFRTADAPILQPDPAEGSLQLTNLKVTAITRTSAVITWRTDERARSRVQYGTVPYTDETPLTTRTELNQSVSLSGLQPGTAYYLRAISVDGDGNQGEISGLHFWTATPGNGLRVQSVVTIRTEATSADLKWATFPSATCDIEYGIGYPYDKRQVVTEQPVTEHRVTLTNLTPETMYYYRPLCVDSKGNRQEPGGFTFTTKAGSPADPEPAPQSPPDPEPAPQVPAIEVDQQSVQATQLSSSSAVITWSTNVPGTAQVYYGTSLSYGQNTPVNQALATQHQITITGLDSATLYYFRSESGDTEGNVDSAGGFSFRTADAPILQPDPVEGSLQLTNLKVTAVTQTSALITWRTDEWAQSRVQYGTVPYTDETPLTTRTQLNQSVSLSGLQPGSAYYLRAISVDGDGNQGEISGLHFWTATASNGLRVQSVVTLRTYATSADLKWATFPSATCDIEYGIGYPYDKHQVVTEQPVTEHRVTLTNLTPETMYYYRPLCVDSKGNRQEPGGFTFTTK